MLCHYFNMIEVFRVFIKYVDKCTITKLFFTGKIIVTANNDPETRI